MRQLSRRACLLFLTCLFLGLAPARAAEKPKVRAITAFVRLEPVNHKAQIAQTLAVLRRAKAAFEKAGYEVQTLRITPQPFSVMAKEMPREQVLAFYAEHEALAKKEGFLSAIGPVLFRDEDDPRLTDLYAEILAQHPGLDGSIIVADEDGVHWSAVRAAARIMKYLEERTPHSQGNFGFAAAAMVEPYTPFYPASYHLGRGQQFAVAVQGASVVDEAFRSSRGDFDKARRSFEKEMNAHALAIADVSKRIAEATGWTFMGVDCSTAPLKDVSIAAAIEKLTGAPFGSSGTLSATALITGVLRELHVDRVGYNGVMLPVLEDERLAQRWSEGRLTLDALLAYSAVCGTGLDTVPLPGDISEAQLARIIGDMASLAHKLRKPLTARLMPVAGKRAGDRTEFADPFLTNAVIQPLPRD